MKVLVANIGSTSFKYRLLDMSDESQLARGGIERIGEDESPSFVEIDGKRIEKTIVAKDHGAAVKECLKQLTEPETGCLADASEVSAIGFKAVHGGRFSGVQLVREEVLEAMEEAIPIAPAHNPPYIKAMRELGEQLPDIPLVAAFETGFHQTIPNRNRFYAVPFEWTENLMIRKWGFHGASHRYIATRTAELLGRDDLRIISCHLGGSSSLCAIKNGESMATSMGTSPQTGLPQNNRVGDFDPFMLPMLMERTGKSLEEVLATLSSEGGLKGLSGVGADIRDIAEAANSGNDRAQLALDVYIGEIRRYLGSYIVELGGVDVIVFTGGIGENRVETRREIVAGLEELGIVIDEAANQSAKGEAPIHAESSRTQLWIIPTNEEIVVARQAKSLVESLK